MGKKAVTVNSYVLKGLSEEMKLSPYNFSLESFLGELNRVSDRLHIDLFDVAKTVNLLIKDLVEITEESEELYKNSEISDEIIKDRDELLIDINNLKSDHINIVENLEDVGDLVKALVEKLNDYEQNYTSADTYKELMTDFDKLSNELNQLKGSSKVEITTLKANNDRLQKEVEELKQDESGNSVWITTLKSDNARLHRKIKELESAGLKRNGIIYKEIEEPVIEAEFEYYDGDGLYENQERYIKTHPRRQNDPSEELYAELESEFRAKFGSKQLDQVSEETKEALSSAINKLADKIESIQIVKYVMRRKDYTLLEGSWYKEGKKLNDNQQAHLNKCLKNGYMLEVNKTEQEKPKSVAAKRETIVCTKQTKTGKIKKFSSDIPVIA